MMIITLGSRAEFRYSPLTRRFSQASIKLYKSTHMHCEEESFAHRPKPGKVNIEAPGGRPPFRKADGSPVLLACTLCGWQKVGTRVTARSHARVVHRGELHVYVPKTPSEIRERRARTCRRSKKGIRKSGQTPDHGVDGDTCRRWGYIYFPAEGQADPCEGSVYGLLCCKGPEAAIGDGSWTILGRLSSGPFRVAVSYVVGLLQSGCLVTANIGDRLLWKATEALTVQVSGCDDQGKGESMGVAAALSLLSLVLGIRPPAERRSVVVTGALDLTGKVHGVGGLVGKLQACMELGASMLMVPASSWSAFDPEAELSTAELRAYAARVVYPYTTLLKAVRVNLCPTFPFVPQLEGAELAASSSGYWVGIAYSMSYVETSDHPLIVQVGSSNRKGRRSGGHGETCVTGVGSDTMTAVVNAAREWTLYNRSAIVGALQVGDDEWDWEKEDLHVHFACGSWEHMCLSLYTAAVAVAMVSYFTGRRSMRRTAIIGAVSPDDRWLSDQEAVSTQPHVHMLQRQGFERLAVAHAAAIAADMLPLLREQGLQLVTAKDDGAQLPTGPRFAPEYSLVPMLPHLLEKA